MSRAVLESQPAADPQSAARETAPETFDGVGESLAAPPSRVGRWLRRLVVRTAVPPLRQLYVLGYQIAAWVVAALLMTEPQIAAVTLRRGCGKGEILPGISDIDFGVAYRDASGPDAHLWFRGLRTRGDWYARLARASHLFEEKLSIRDLDHQEQRFLTQLVIQYNTLEDAAAGRLLFGEDYTAGLPPLSPMQKQTAGYHHLLWWWGQLGAGFLHPTAAAPDSIHDNALCYRYVTDLLRGAENIRTGKPRFHRSGVLEAAIPALLPEDAALVERILAHRRSRFLRGDAALPADTIGFALRFLERFWAELREHPLGGPARPVRQRIEYDQAEAFDTPIEAMQTDALGEWLHAEWGDACRSVRAAPTICYDVDELLLLIEGDPGRLPTREQLMALNARLHAGRAERRRPIYAFLLLPEAAHRLGWWFARPLGWKMILPTVCVPHLHALAGVETRPLPAADWPPLMEYFAFANRLRYRQLVALRQERDWSTLGFLRAFWKSCQLVVMHRRLADGEAVYALTLPAIERELAALGSPLPAELAPLHEAYHAAVLGGELDVGAYLALARQYLERIDPGGAEFDLARVPFMTGAQSSQAAR